MNDGEDWTTIRFPALIATALAGYLAWHFRLYLPVPQEWTDVESVLKLLAQLDLVLHQAGHRVFALAGSDFLRAAGGTILQLGIPAAALAYFLKEESRSGAAVMLFWMGEILVNTAWYAADAATQAFIPLAGMSGAERGHDWNYILGTLGAAKDCVGIGQAMFFCGCWLMIFSVCWFVELMRRYFRTGH